MDTISLSYTHLAVPKWAEKAFLAAGFLIMTALGAYVRIPLPFTPVPITLQTFFVILCGAVLGKKLGTLTQSAYLLLGVLGLPIFQGYGAGLLHIAGPTGGYLAGFIVSAYITGSLVSKNAALAMLAGLFVIYACGASWLMIGYGFNIAKAISLGVLPFIPGAALKLIAASWIYAKIKQRI